MARISGLVITAPLFGHVMVPMRVRARFVLLLELALAPAGTPPVLIVLLLANGALGVLARTIPQLNVFVVGFPLNVGAGLLVLGASLPFTFRFLEHEFGTLAGTLAWLVRGVSHG